MRIMSNVVFVFSFIYTISLLIYITVHSQPAVLANTNHIVISQIQISGTGNANDEFVELYNPTEGTIVMDNWRLSRKTATGSVSQNLVSVLDGILPPRSYFLITHPSAIAASLADALYSSSSSAITTNNTIVLYSDAGQTIVDKVGMGTATDFEITPFPQNPANNQSIIRKASNQSTEQTIITGGIDAVLGNGYDTDNNAHDYLLIDTSQPHNSHSAPALPTVTANPSQTPTPSIIPPTITPLPTPTVRELPTVVPNPTSMPIPTPTIEPSTTIVPVSTPMITPSPIPTLMPSSTPFPTVLPTPAIIVDTNIGEKRFICRKYSRQIKFFHYIITIPMIKCTFVTIH